MERADGEVTLSLSLSLLCAKKSAELHSIAACALSLPPSLRLRLSLPSGKFGDILARQGESRPPARPPQSKAD